MRKISTIIVLIGFSALFLSGCISMGHVEIRLTIDVEKNGSGIVSAAIGMTPDAKSLLSWGGESAQTILDEAFSTEGYEMTIRQWVTGEYEWLEGSVPFDNLDELNRHIANNEIIKAFSLTRQRNLVKDQFILDAELAPVGSDFVDISLVVNLPGEVIQTNGIFQGETSSILWRLDRYQPTRISTVSESFRYLNIGLLAVGSCIGGLLFLFLVLFLVTRIKTSKKKNSNYQISKEKETSTEIDKTNPDDEPTLIDKADVINILTNTNQEALNGQGEVVETQSGITLLFHDPQEQQLKIEFLSSSYAKINEKIFPMVLEEIKKGIEADLREKIATYR